MSTQNSAGTGTDISFAHGKKEKKVKKDRKKSKLAMKNPMQQSEHDIVMAIAKTKFFYELIHLATTECTDLAHFYTLIQARTDLKSALSMRYETTISYLKMNATKNPENREPFVQV